MSEEQVTTQCNAFTSKNAATSMKAAYATIDGIDKVSLSEVASAKRTRDVPVVREPLKSAHRQSHLGGHSPILATRTRSQSQGTQPRVLDVTKAWHRSQLRNRTSKPFSKLFCDHLANFRSRGKVGAMPSYLPMANSLAAC
eukprot:3728103-Pleurochrysis_carterae.AAC.1